MVSDQALKDLIKGIGDLANFISNVSGGFSFSEVTELVELVDDIPVLLADAPAIAQQYASLDDAARAELVAYTKSNVSFPSNASVEAVIEKVLQVAIQLSALLEIIKA